MMYTLLPPDHPATRLRQRDHCSGQTSRRVRRGHRPALSIVPFEALEPRWKVLAIEGDSPVDKGMNTLTYPLMMRIGLVANGETGNRGAALILESGAWLTTNRDPAKLTYVVMTGVTALSRAVAMQMETQSMDFPAREIMPFLASADILHTSNEASFTPECPEPSWTGEPIFCEQRDYFELLRSIGLDIVELTGNHNLDYGTDAALNSLDVYDNEGLPYFGGGRNLDDAITPRVLTGPDGTRFGFVGCNSAGPFGAWATQATPGAAPCDDWTRIQQQIAGLKMGGEADVVIVTVQHMEFDQYHPTEQQRADFEALALAGADIVSGSQAHQPQGFSFVGGRLVHFGVGNLFFDQIDLEGNRQMFADRHVFYEGRHISTVLFTGYFQTIGQPRPMTPAERADFLRTIFAASGW
jgi:poly-gamma-glutamate synthesis protein (capsule biosynthesis protein)